MIRRFLASFLVFAMAAGEFPVRAAGVSALGVVTEASRANLSSTNVSAGTTVYDGDSLTTASDGFLRVRAGAAQLYLPSQSGVKLHSVSGGTLAQLTGGTLVFSSAKAAAMDIEIAQAHVRPTSDQPTVAQISVAGPKMIDIRAQRGSLQFSYNGETQLVPEGSAYRFVLDPSEEESVAAAMNSFPDQQAPHKGRRRKRSFIFFLIGAGALFGLSEILVTHEALESPSKP
jgi:hypothetical protein